MEKGSTAGVATSINSWIKTLESHKELKTIASDLEKLKEAISAKDGKKIADLMTALGSETTKAAESAKGGAAAAQELETPAAGRQVRYVASDERTANEIAHILGASIGKPDLKWVMFTDEQMQSGMEQRGVPAHIAAKFVELGESIHSGALRQDYDLHKPAVMGKVKLEDFVKEFAAAFLKG